MRERKYKDLVGKTFSYLTVLEELPNKQKIIEGKIVSSTRVIRCLCVCGKIIIKNLQSVVCSKTRSCGCLCVTKYGKQELDIPEGYLKNCDRNHDLFLVWQNMVQRCYNHKNTRFSDYGGRGIKVCDRWLMPNGLGFKNFTVDMVGRPDKTYHLDRLDPDSDYSLDNCRWISKNLSAYNTRKQRNNTSGTTGVYWEKESNNWKAAIMYNGKLKNLGRFKDFEEAVAVRKAAEMLVYGENKSEHNK